MLLAIDIGNTQTVVGIQADGAWRHVWRRETNARTTEDELAAWMHSLFQASQLPFAVEAIVCASVVPSANAAVEHLARKWFGVAPLFLSNQLPLGIEVRYDPPHAVGADRLANALGALAKYAPPIVVVDFGTATTFDSIGADGAYVGGAILPGVMISTQALVERTAKLPQIEFKAPPFAVGRSTVESLQSGIVLGYAGAIDALARRIRAELGETTTIISTGGLSGLFTGVCETIQHHEPTLTLEGMAIAYDRVRPDRAVRLA